MAPKKTTVSKAAEPHGYEFWWAEPLVYPLDFPCSATRQLFSANDISGCPVPSSLSPSTLTISNLKQEAGWPANGLAGLSSWDVFLKVVGYYLLSMVLHRVLPGEEKLGVELASGGKLKYKFNTWSSTLFTLALCAAGTIAQGADFPPISFISYALATFVYIRSFSVKPGNPELRELAAGGHSGNMLYDWFIGRELNPRVTLPLLGEIDIKEFCELRPGLMGWLLMDYAFVGSPI
ncbi:hypothetical protein DID88_006905 [Monilinia fructigena]|uniref:Delta(14)-sterol reductase n=1 Tax=Monilinia fructigena TaxID=38457 RepID=A0A395IGE7_9HELO|nr:hypothetical protein DID88_006905 [Monilinia fructigena]